MKPWVAIFSMGLASLLPPSLAYGATETDREIARSFANFYLSQKKPLEAKKILQEHIQADAKDAASWNLLGILQMKEGQVVAAETSFKSALGLTKSHEPEYGPYLYNLADAFARQKKKSEAVRALRRAKLLANVSGSAADALQSYSDGSPLPPLQIEEPPRWSGSLSMRGGYDSNVLLFSDVSFAGATPSDMASPFAQLALRGSYRKGSSAFGPMELRGFAFGTYETSVAARTFSSILGSLGMEFGRTVPEDPGFGWSWGIEGLGTLMNSDGLKPYLVNGQAFWNGALRHSASAVTQVEVPIRYQLYFVPSTTPAEDIRNGLGGRVKLVHQRMFGAQKLSGGLTYEIQLPSGRNFKSHELAVPIAWTFPVVGKLSGNLSGELGRTWYPESLLGRLDTFWKLGAGVVIHMNTNWMVALDYQFRRNVSTVGSAMYFKHQGTGALTYVF